MVISYGKKICALCECVRGGRKWKYIWLAVCVRLFCDAPGGRKEAKILGDKDQSAIIVRCLSRFVGDFVGMYIKVYSDTEKCRQKLYIRKGLKFQRLFEKAPAIEKTPGQVCGTLIEYEPLISNSMY